MAGIVVERRVGLLEAHPHRSIVPSVSSTDILILKLHT